MLLPWLQDIESLEAISQDAETRRVVLRMASLSRSGTLPDFLVALARDPEIDEATKQTLAEVARDRAFLLALEEYLRRTRRFH
jgi:hypothetical protein